MKNRNKLYTFILSLVLVFAMVTSVFAEGGVDLPTEPPTTEGGTETPTDTATVTKQLEVAEGIILPDLTFKFTATPVAGQNGAPDVTISDITFTSDDVKGTPTDGKYVIKKTAEIEVGDLTATGNFQYKLTEVKNTYDGENGEVTYSTDEYKLFVTVANGAKGAFYVKSITVKINDKKVEDIIFTNKYTKNASLSIAKKVEGELADQSKDFEFKITFWKAGTSQSETFTGVISGEAEDEEVVCTNGVEKIFYLHHGEQLVFAELPAGTRYKVEEVGAIDGYKASVVVIENGSSRSKPAAADKDGITTEADGKNNCLVGENTNSVIFTNTHTEVAPTGILMNNLPFLLLVGIGICALGVLAVSKKRRTSKRQ